MSSAPIEIPAAAAEVETPSAFEVGQRPVPLGATMPSTSIDTKNSLTKKELIDQIEQLKKKLEQEKINHTVSMKFLQNQREERQQELNKLQLETGKILQEMEDQVYSLRRKTTQTIDKRMEVMWKINEMKKVVMEDRKEQEKQRQLEVSASRAATTLQTWWRSCMVRRQLGPYKKSKDKKVKKKKGNDEKGKKKAGDQKKGNDEKGKKKAGDQKKGNDEKGKKKAGDQKKGKKK